MLTLTALQSELLATIQARCPDIPGVCAIALGGSYARNRARPGSDLDIGLYYRASDPIDVESVRALAVSLNDTPSPVVTDIGAWGRWVNGGAWLTLRGQRTDLLYRCIDAIDACWSSAEDGQFELDFGQQPPFGFFGPTLLGELSIARPLADPEGVLAELKNRVSAYPDPLRQSVVQKSLWDAQFTLRAFAPKYVTNGDAWGASACFARCVHRQILALFALNRIWLINDKTALDEIREFANAPSDFSERAHDLMAHTGSTPDALKNAFEKAEQLFLDTADCADGLYTPTWTI